MTRHHEDCDVYQAQQAKEANEALGVPNGSNDNPEDYACNSGCEPEIAFVTGTITFDNGETVEFDLYPTGDTRRGDSNDALGYAGPPCAAMWSALADGNHFSDGKEN